MTNPHLTTLSTIQDIEAKDRRFRAAQAIFMIAAVLLLVSALSVGYIQLKAGQQQVKTLQHRLAQNDTDNSVKLADLQDHIDCLFKIATTPHTTTSPPQVSSAAECKLSVASSPASPSVSPIATPKSAMSTPKSTPAPTSSAPPQAPATTPPQQNVPAPAPHPLVCNLTLGLVGCK